MPNKADAQQGPVEFTDKALVQIAAAIPPEAPPERVALLPELMRAWAVEDLAEHLSREGRSVKKKRSKSLANIAAKACSLLDEIATLDRHARILLADKPQMRREALTGNPRWARFGLPDDHETGERRRDEALAWLSDLAETLDVAEEKPPPDRRTISYLIVLDLAFLFELVSCIRPTRRIKADTGQGYGPFHDFCKRVGHAFGGIGSLDRAIRDVVAAYPEVESSGFVSNLQFRHPDLWKVLRQ